MVDLTRSVVDIRSVSGTETELADAVERALSDCSHLDVERIGNTVVARTNSHRSPDGRVVIAGHLDTVPEADNLPSRLIDDAGASGRERAVAGLGACDMKGGVAIALRLAATVTAPARPISYVWYDCEEVEAERNGLGRLAASRPELLRADFAVLMEPSSAQVEAGCQGTLRAEVLLTGTRAHSARAWKGKNAIHQAADALGRLADYRPRQVEVDGLVYREGLNAVGISGGVAGNVIPDECRITVNYRFAPSRSEEQALAHVREVFDGYRVELADSAPGAMPGLETAPAREFLEAVGASPYPKFGWTDVARFSALGIPAVNYGPGDSSLAHTRDEYVCLDELYRCEQRLRDWIG